MPSIEETEAGWLRWHWIPYWPERLLLNKWTRKVIWMVFVIIAPEIGVALATAEYLSAKIALNDKEKTEVESVQNQPTSEKGVGIVDSGATAIKKDVGIPERRAKQQKLTVSHAFCANMGRFKVKMYEGGDSKSYYEGIILNYEGLEKLRQSSIDLEIPIEEDIQGLGNSDVFSKAFACVQSASLVIQCIARALARLPITQLELATIAFVTCGILMYLLWWNKPFGLERRGLIISTVPNHAQSDFFQNLRYERSFCLSTEVPLPDESTIPSDLWDERIQQRDIFNSNFGGMKEGGLMGITQIVYRAIIRLLGISTKPIYPSIPGGMTASFFISGTIFSALHIFALNFSFPSTPIQIAWRTFAVNATSMNLMSILAIFMNSKDIGNREWGNTVSLTGLMLLISSISYYLSRLGLIVLTFLCFYSMPAAVYQTVDWTKFLPHCS